MDHLGPTCMKHSSLQAATHGRRVFPHQTPAFTTGARPVGWMLGAPHESGRGVWAACMCNAHAHSPACRLTFHPLKAATQEQHLNARCHRLNELCKAIYDSQSQVASRSCTNQHQENTAKLLTYKLILAHFIIRTNINIILHLAAVQPSSLSGLMAAWLPFPECMTCILNSSLQKMKKEREVGRKQRKSGARGPLGDGAGD